MTVELIKLIPDDFYFTKWQRLELELCEPDEPESGWEEWTDDGEPVGERRAA